MPTGLTEKIYYGDDTSLRGFALKCVTNLGFGYHVSKCGETNLPLDKAPVAKPSEYHKEELELAKKQLKEFMDLQKDPDALRKMYEEHIEKVEKNEEEKIKETEQIKERYLSVLDKVNNWNAPSEFDSLINLMKEQLNDCIEYDCTIYNCDKQKESLEDWVNSEISSINWRIDYHKKEYEKDIKYANDCNEYIQKLYEELDKVEPLK